MQHTLIVWTQVVEEIVQLDFESSFMRVVQNAKKWDSYPATSFLEPIGLVMKENAKKVGKSYHLGVPIDPPLVYVLTAST